MIFQNSLSHFTDILDYSLTFGLASDVTLVTCDGERFLAHKFALSVASSVMKSIFMEIKSENTSLLFADTNSILLKALLYYIYFGTVKLSAEYKTDLSLLIENLGINSGSFETEIYQENTANQLDAVERVEESLEENEINGETVTDIEKIDYSDSKEKVESFEKFELLKDTNQIGAA